MAYAGLSDGHSQVSYSIRKRSLRTKAPLFSNRKGPSSNSLQTTRDTIVQSALCDEKLEVF